MGAKRSSRVPRVFKKPCTHRQQSGSSSPKSEIQGAICLRDRVTKRSKTPTRQPRAAKENTCEMNRPDAPAQPTPKHSPALGDTRAIWRDHSSRYGSTGIRLSCRQLGTRRIRVVATVVTPDGAAPFINPSAHFFCLTLIGQKKAAPSPFLPGLGPISSLPL